MSWMLSRVFVIIIGIAVVFISKVVGVIRFSKVSHGFFRIFMSR